MQRLANQTELQLLEVAQTAVEHLRTATGGAGGEVACFDQRHPQAAGGGIQGGADTHHAAADHHDVELFGAQPLPGLSPLRRSKIHAPKASRGAPNPRQ